MSDFPSTKYQRGKIFAQTGLQVGKNYASHYLKSLTGNGKDTTDLYRKTAEDMFGQFTKLRGTALKIAQSFSVDQGFLPEEFSEVMAKAQYKVPPINRTLVRSIIKRELGQYPEQLFKHFDTEAMAAASIGQVHRATLQDGTEAAVKIQYPGVRDTISSDIALAKTIFKQLVAKGTDLTPYIEEVRSTLLKETDYTEEGQSIDRFHKRFSSKDVVTPKWLPQYSTERVLTMTFIDGMHLNEFLSGKPDQSDIDKFGQLLWDFFHSQIENGEEYHADTHPGNFLFTKDGKLGVIDFGCVKTFPEEFFMNYLKLLPTHLNRNDEEIKALYKELDVLLADPEKDEKEMEVYEFCKNYGYTFAMPYVNDSFNFGDKEYKNLLKGYTKNPPFTNKPRGNKHFIYTTRVHLGLYHLLMTLGSKVNTMHSKEILENIFKNR
jgi:predicted unusual protein kinase regulating ubiquinone biosynthesis (AarF/ABC1/UbiB family)